MRELSGTAAGKTSATLDDALALLLAADRYPEWYPEVVREVQVLEPGEPGHPQLVRTKLHVARGPLSRDFDLVMRVEFEPPGTVRLRKSTEGSEQRFEVTWRLADEGGGTRIELALAAALAVPRMMPLGGIGDAMAQGFVAAATHRLG